MKLTRSQLLYAEIKERFQLHFDLLSSPEQIEPRFSKPTDFREAALQLKPLFDQLIPQCEDLARLYKKEQLVSLYFAELIADIRLYQKGLSQKGDLMLLHESEAAESSRVLYMLVLFGQYERLAKKLSFLQANNFIPVLKPLRQINGATFVPTSMLMRRQAEKDYMPRLVSLAYVARLPEAPGLIHKTTTRIHQVLAHTMSMDLRAFSGNMNRMNPNSKEDGDLFPAYRYNDYWSQILEEGGALDGL